MYIIFHRERERDIDDRFDGGDVETPDRDVDGDEERAEAAFESGERGAAFFLREVAVDGADVEAPRAEEGFDARGFFFVEAEDENAVVLAGARGVLVLAQELQEAGLFLARVDYFDELGYAGVGAEFAGGVVGVDGDVHGRAHEGEG